jgi:hypothetical protein
LHDVPSDLARQWRPDAAAVLLDFVWKGYDSLRSNHFSQVDCSQPTDNLERGITQLLAPWIRHHMSGDEPFSIEHGIFEEQTRQHRGQPPAYDLAFCWYQENPRFLWPLEAKVLYTDDDAHGIRQYVNEVRDNYLPCRYAPFSSEAAMLGYLFSGDVSVVLQNIGRRLRACGMQCRLIQFPVHSSRPHKTSKHVRSGHQCRYAPREFRCHHMILKIE